MRGDLRREVLGILDSRDPSNHGIRWTEVASALDEQSSIVRYPPPLLLILRWLLIRGTLQPIESTELTEVIRSLEQDGTLRVSGDRERRTLRRAGAGGV